ncbi:MAG TPA: hypothetical protein VFP91_06880 [Vicinamibacterales bacterium]|nr:hypothetical protein [Vicinamibacterales bacterium]
MTVIKLPITPKHAFNPRRPAGALLLAQIEHLEHAVGIEPKRIKRTEGQAAKYIAELTAEVLKQSQQPTAPAPSPTVTAAPASHPVVPVGTKTVGTKHHAAPARTSSAPKMAKRSSPKKKTAKRRRTR